MFGWLSLRTLGDIWDEILIPKQATVQSGKKGFPGISEGGPKFSVLRWVTEARMVTEAHTCLGLVRVQLLYQVSHSELQPFLRSGPLQSFP